MVWYGMLCYVMVCASVPAEQRREKAALINMTRQFGLQLGFGTA
jgi:hypothetical protein